MGEFKYRQFEGEIIIQCVRWYCKYGISYRDLEEMMLERGIEVDHTTIYRWVQRYAPEIEKKMRWYLQGGTTGSWRVDETYIKVKGKWKYLYRAVDSKGRTIDFYTILEMPRQLIDFCPNALAESPFGLIHPL